MHSLTHPPQTQTDTHTRARTHTYNNIFEQAARRQLDRKLRDLKGNVRVFCRVRPLVAGNPQALPLASSFADVALASATRAAHRSSGGSASSFEYDAVFGPTSTQAELYAQVHELVPSVLDGFDVCIFAYGATGSGKTFTMTGPVADRGLNPRALQDILAHAERRRGEEESVELRVSMLEIYNNRLRDLMGEAAKGEAGEDSCKLELTPAFFSEWTGPAAFAAAPPGLFSARVHNVDDIMTVMATGNALRARASTELNTLSSRSHTVLLVHATTTNLLTGGSTVGRMHLIDLAGSEDAGRSGARRQGGALSEEAQHINSSLEALGKVMRAHARKTPPDQIDYGDSALTQLLQGSLQAQTKMVMLIHVNPSPSLAAEARQTLEFGASVRDIELGEARARSVGLADAAHRGG
ncbi:P-loop containing nucleoside triphosphate hydrolase protein [Pavlovales sp. CCMP2436]|nr:P-loop containing nucleoside triphosphate hydrolase protein [Pavlovales sp. CCMP2436]